MNFDLTDDQQEIKRTARDLLGRRSPLAKVREAAEAGRYDDALWRELGELGWPGIAVAEEHGGQGLGAVELAVLLEELGYACAASPFLRHARWPRRRSRPPARDEQRARWLPGLAAGELRGAASATRRPAGRRRRRARRVLVLVDDGARGCSRAATPTSSRSTRSTRRAATRACGRRRRAAARRRAAGVDRARVAVAAELVGVCQRALDMTLAYVKERKQFGMPVGAFQAVSHRCAQMLLRHRGRALERATSPPGRPTPSPSGCPRRRRWPGAAAADAGRDVTASAIQAHGGIGFTWEADVHWLYKRAQLDARCSAARAPRAAGPHRGRSACARRRRPSGERGAAAAQRSPPRDARGGSRPLAGR